MSAFNGWWLKLPEGRQAVLIEDKWMLAHAAFEAGRQQHLLEWKELTEGQQKVAQQAEYDAILRGVCEGSIEFKDGDIAAGVKRAGIESESMRTPWFFPEYVQKNVGDLLMQVALTEAQRTLYINPSSERSISILALPQI